MFNKVNSYCIFCTQFSCLLTFSTGSCFWSHLSQFFFHYQLHIDEILCNDCSLCWLWTWTFPKASRELSLHSLNVGTHTLMILRAITACWCSYPGTDGRVGDGNYYYYYYVLFLTSMYTHHVFCFSLNLSSRLSILLFFLRSYLSRSFAFSLAVYVFLFNCL